MKQLFIVSKSLFVPICIAIAILALGKLPFISAGYGHDQAGYMYEGRQIARGAIPYRDIFDHKNPGLPYFNAIVYSLGGNSLVIFRLVEFAWTVLTILIFSILLRKIFPKNNLIVLGFGIIYFSILLANINFSTVDGGGYTESYLLLPSLLAIILIIKYEKTRKKIILPWIGLLIFVSFMFKQSGITIVLPIIYYLSQINIKSGIKKLESVKTILLDWLYVGLEFLIPLGLFILYLFYKGALLSYLDNTITFNRFYSGTSTLADKILGSLYTTHQQALAYPISYFLLVLGLIYLVYRRTKYTWLIIVWLISDFIGIGLSGRFFGHYYIQAFPVLAIITTGGFVGLYQAINNNIKQNKSNLILLALPFFLLIFIPYFSTPTINYMLKWRGFQKSIVALNWSNHSPELIKYLKDYTKPNDYIYIWDSAQIYAYLDTGTVSSSHYYHGIPFSQNIAPGYVTTIRWEGLKRDLEIKPPTVILINETLLKGIKNNQIIWEYISSHYRLDKTIDDVNGHSELYLPKG